MPYPIKKALGRKNIKSNDGLAQMLINMHPDAFVDKKGIKLNVRTLGTKIGELDRGMTSWWRNSPRATEKLIAFLGIWPDELDLSPVGGRNRFSFPSFPAFPPLTLTRETPWRIAEAKRSQDSGGTEPGRYGTKPTLDFWLEKKKRPGMPPSSVQWLWVPDDVEFELLTRWLAAIETHPVIRVATPEMVIIRHIDELASSDSLIVVLEGVGDAEQVGQLASVRQDAPLLIIARDALPVFATQDEQAKESSARAAHARIERWTWTFLPDWRQVLIRSVERRIFDLDADNQFSSQATLDLVEKFDRSRQWFASVNDVLVLCQAVCEGEEKNLGIALDSGTDTGALLSLLFSRDEAHLGQMQDLVKERWLRWTLSWSADLTRQEWLGLVKTEERFETMVSRNLLGQHGHGYRFQRPVVTRLLLRSYLVECMNKAELTSWAQACFDDERRPLVDAALDALTVEALQKLARKVGAACVDRLYLGAAEALFAAFGRRPLDQDINGQVLAEFAAIVLPRLRKYEDRLLPLSRPQASPADQVAWTTVCWAWSMRLRVRPLLAETTWLFPGWSDDLPKMPGWLDTFGRKHTVYSWELLGPQLRDFLSIARAWLVSGARNVDDAMLPPLFRMALLVEASTAAGAAKSWWWDGVIGDPWAEQALLECMRDHESGPVTVALAWWKSLLRNRQQASKEQQFGASSLFTWHPRANGHSSLLAAVTECLGAHAAIAVQSLEKDERLFLADHALALPPSLQRELLKSVAQDQDANWYDWEIPGFMAKFGPQVADVLPHLLDHPQLGQVAAWRLWEWVPAMAEELLQTYRGPAGVGIRNLIEICPPAAIRAALAVHQRQPSLMNGGQWRDWALRRLSNARVHAPALLELIEPPPLTLVN
jgi:hypothetical protein